MNILNKVTLQGLKKNRTRTIVTIIGVILAVSMITGITTFIASLQNYLLQNEIATSGDWHVKFMNVDDSFVQKIKADKEVKKVVLSNSEIATPGSTSKDLSVTMKSPAKVYDFTERVAGNTSYEYHGALLRFYGVSANDNFNKFLYGFGGILIVIIMIGGILLIYNSFAISVSERSRQFGILSSVGATKKQLRRSVLFEGICIGAIGIPIGLLAGVGGIGITLKFVSGLFKSIMIDSDTAVRMHVTLSLVAIGIAALMGALTILISAYIPARRAMRKSAIEIIRQSDDVKIKARSMKISKPVRSLFGLEGTLAIKNFKRNKKRYRSTVISLFVSLVLFISASAFGMYLRQSTEMTIKDLGFDISFSVSQGKWHLEDSKLINLFNQMKSVEGVTKSTYWNDIACSAPVKSTQVNNRFIEYQKIAADDKEENIDVGMNVCFINDALYNKAVSSLGLSPNEYGVDKRKLLAVDKVEGYDSNVKRTVSFRIFNKDSVSLMLTPSSGENNESTTPQKFSLTLLKNLPKSFSQIQVSNMTVFAPYSDMAKFNAPANAFNGINMTFSSDDPMKSAAKMENIIDKSDAKGGYSLYNVAKEIAQIRNVLMIVNVFTYGFVILISLITIANVFNTISTGINLRRREFAMLRSVGMGVRSFSKMMNFECLFYGLKALLYGLPVSAAISWLIYRSAINGVDLTFTLPWSSIAISVFSVFFVVFVTMLYATDRIKKANVIDALRMDG